MGAAEKLADANARAFRLALETFGRTGFKHDTGKSLVDFLLRDPAPPRGRIKDDDATASDPRENDEKNDCGPNAECRAAVAAADAAARRATPEWRAARSKPCGQGRAVSCLFGTRCNAAAAPAGPRDGRNGRRPLPGTPGRIPSPLFAEQAAFCGGRSSRPAVCGREVSCCRPSRANARRGRCRRAGRVHELAVGLDDNPIEGTRLIEQRNSCQQALHLVGMKGGM